jgi:ligand-binding SRPBCC domain-containing protein
MTTIELTTVINAPIQLVFDHARNIDTHQESPGKSNEIAIAGRTSGLINKRETVTWRGKHFGVFLQHQSVISQMEQPTYFIDEQLKGNFKSFKHQHFFEQKNGQTIMKDIMQYETPFRIFGKIFDAILLKKHLTQFLIDRNAYLKLVSEKTSGN